MKQAITSRSARWLAALGLGLTQFGISGPGQPQPAQAVVGKVCLPFTTLAPLQPSYVVGNSFTENAQLVMAGPFTWADSTVFAGGNAARVASNMALGSLATEMQVNNITLGTAFGTPMTQVSFKFGEFGGNINLRINGNLANVDNFDDVNAAVIGGVLVQVFGDGDGQGAGEVVLSGVINSVGVGGQELWIDDLCFSDVPDDGTPNDPVPPVQAKADLGDAPDSTNHYALNNTAYTFPGVVFGQYPTVFTSGIATDAPGPLHRRTDVFWLGGAVTGEREADQMPDSDGISNILGLTAIVTTATDIANLDKADDGWLNRAMMAFEDCRPSTMVIRVTRGVVPLPANAFVRFNSWFDGNRNGDWADRGQCIVQPGTPPATSFEWIVQNELIPVGAIAPGGSQVFTIPTALVYNPNPTPTHWVRLSLGGMATVTVNSATGAMVVTDLEPFPTAPFLPDGRGPAGAYRAGETEDFFIEIVPPDDPPVVGKPDLGDAPDSVQNHWPLTPNNTAYFGPLTLGRFPTVWQSTAPGTDPSGPRHQNAPFHGWLGVGITAEREADIGADADPTNNIKNGGADSSNRDLKDDGWLNPGVVFPNCGTTTLRVRVSRDLASAMPRMYLNTWFDGNRDGDWQDTDLECPQGPIAGQNRRWEWIVQNHIINMGAIPPGGFVDLNVPTKRILNNFPNIEHWVRFSLTEEPLTISNTTVVNTLAPALPFRADGRGKQFPLQWRAGETEDYIVETNQHLDPGVLRIDKSLINPYGVNTANQVITYVIEIDHIGGFGPATTVMTDPLPAGVTPVGMPIVSNPVPSAGPLAATLAGNLLTWNGWINPGGRIRIEQPVKVNPCLGLGFKIIRNTAYAQQTPTVGGGIISDTVVFEEKCKGIIWPGDPVGVGGGITWTLKVNPDVAAPGDVVEAELTVLNKTTETVRITTGWDLKANKKVLAREGDPPVCPVTRELNGLPPGEPVIIRKSLRISPDLDEDGIEDDGIVFVQVTMALEDEPNRCVVTVAPVKIVQTDLGDAPDSSNHPGATMLAYAGVTATYPSVFDPATGAPSGPIHHKPQHFHLGPRVSVERDADLLPDADPTTNLRPVLDLKNLDRWDDGVNLALVKFKDCEVTKLPVQVFVDPVAKFWMTSTQKLGYINVWVDSNRDGDWNDRYDCPQTAGTPPSLATDHIVINHAVNPAALALGLTTISVPTSKVKWFNDNPAWLRVTLTTKPITTPFTFGSINYSDGRGEPYRLGETEDYVWRDVQQNPGDVSINKTGRVISIDFPPHDLASAGQAGLGFAKIAWAVEMANSGDAPVTVQMRDDLPEGWTLSGIRVIGADLDPDAGIFSAPGEPRRKGWDGTIKGNARVAVLIAMTRTVPIDWPTEWPNRVLTVTNSAVLTVTSGSDSDPGNNSSSATVVVSPQRPPVITGPGDGTVCDGTVALTGLALPGASVDVYLNAVLVGSTVALGSGRWSYTLTGLSNGSHSIHAQVGALSSTAIVVIVDTALAYSPLSMLFTDSAGNTSQPRDGGGRTDDGGWILLLHPFDTYTFSVKLCCTDPNATIDLIINGVTTALSDPDSDMIYTGVFTTGTRGPMSMTIRCLCYGIIRDSDGLVLIDPYGEVSDVNNNALLAGATVTAMELQGNAYGMWNAGAYNQINPQLTLADGWYSFFTPPGTYQIAVTRAGYQNYRSSDIVVTNALVRHDVALTPVVSDPIKYRVQLTGDGPEPALLKIKPGDVVEFVAVAVQNNNTVRSNRGGALARGNAANPDFDSGTLLPGESFVVKFSEKGTVSYNDGANPGTIVVESGRPVFLPAVTR